jgi:hypothetical protein
MTSKGEVLGRQRYRRKTVCMCVSFFPEMDGADSSEKNVAGHMERGNEKKTNVADPGRAALRRPHCQGRVGSRSANPEAVFSFLLQVRK